MNARPSVEKKYCTQKCILHVEKYRSWALDHKNRECSMLNIQTGQLLAD